MPEKPRVLVLDDDPSLLRAISLSLRLEGYEVETAVDGIDGLEVLSKGEFDVIVLDLQMPRMDGRAFYGELRQRGFQMPVLVLSAYGAHDARRELGAEGAVSKPFDPSDLVSTIGRLLPGDGRRERVQV